jgi:hypothetical protein
MRIMFYGIYYMLDSTYKFNIHCYGVCIYFMRIMFYGIYYMLNSIQQIQYSQYDVHIFHAHHGLWHILHAYSNIQIQTFTVMVCIYFMRIMFYSIYYMLNSTYKFNIQSYSAAYISCALCFMAYFTC